MIRATKKKSKPESYLVADKMHAAPYNPRKMFKKGWFTSLTTKPKALHLMLSPFHIGVTDVYLNDLRESIATVKDGDNESMAEVRYS